MLRRRLAPVPAPLLASRPGRTQPSSADAPSPCIDVLLRRPRALRRCRHLVMVSHPRRLPLRWILPPSTTTSSCNAWSRSSQTMPEKHCLGLDLVRTSRRTSRTMVLEQEQALGCPLTQAMLLRALRSKKKGRENSSTVWSFFEELFTEVNGVRKRYAARSAICKRELKAPSNQDTGTLARHQMACQSKVARSHKKQTMIGVSDDGAVCSWVYDPKVARVELVRLIARTDFSLSISESDAFEEYTQHAHNPQYKGLSRSTTTSDAKYFEARRAKLIESLSTSVSPVCITSDIWSGNAKKDYLSVVIHFMCSNWYMQKRIIGFYLIDVSYSGDNIAERISTILDDYCLTDKVFAITLDNASANTSAMRSLTPKLSGYLDSSIMLHQRHACHIINLIVKSGLKRLKPFLEDFRTVISFLNSSNQRITTFKQFCIASGKRSRKFGLVMDVRWNLTFLMLKHLVPYKDQFGVYISANYVVPAGTRPLLTHEHWYVAGKILSFLERFYESTVALSGVYYPTAPLMLYHILLIAKHLSMYENDTLLRSSVFPMKTKFLKYWQNIPMLYAFAFILDPRAKMKLFNKLLGRLSIFVGTNYSMFCTNVHSEMTIMFNKYDSKYGAVRLQRPAQPSSSTSKKRTAWGDIFGDDESAPSFSAGPSPSPSAGYVSGLNSYLDSDTIGDFNDEFDILEW